MISSDMSIKKGRYIARNIEINQEFYFADIQTKIKINNIYNSSWFGSVLWDIFSPPATTIESTHEATIVVAGGLNISKRTDLNQLEL